MHAQKSDMLLEFSEVELIQLTDRDTPTTGAIVDTVLDRAIDGASAEIDGYLARYAGQVLNLPILTRYCCDMARYRLYRDAAPEEVRKRYEDAIGFLRMVAAGKITLGVQAEAAVPENTIHFDTGQKVFAREPIE